MLRHWSGNYQYGFVLDRTPSLLNVSGNKTLCIRFFQYIFSTPQHGAALLMRPHSYPQESVQSALIRGKKLLNAAHRQADPLSRVQLFPLSWQRNLITTALSHFRPCAIHMEGLILPLLHRVQRGLYQAGMSAFGLCGGNMTLFIDQHMQNSIALKLVLFFQRWILRFYILWINCSSARSGAITGRPNSARVESITVENFVGDVVFRKLHGTMSADALDALPESDTALGLRKSNGQATAVATSTGSP